MCSILRISDDLRLSVEGVEVRLTPSQGLAAAEDLARKSFRRALAEEAEAVEASPCRVGTDGQGAQ